MLVKACLQGAFSLMVFGWAQILIDLQPLIVLLRGVGELHGWSHTYAGATLIALVAAPSGKLLGEYGLRRLRLSKYNPIAWSVAWFSAFVGTYSHVLIDGIMHADMRPWSPFAETRLFYAAIGIEMLHLLCIGGAVIGGAGFYLVERWRQRD